MTGRTRALTTTTAAAAAITMSVALAGAACGGGGDGDRTDATRPPIVTTTAPGVTTTGPARGAATTSTTVPHTPGQLAVAAYNASWDATFRALDPPRQLPELATLMTGDALSETSTQIAEQARERHYTQGSMQTHPKVVSATATEVIIDDCTVENSVEYDATGKAVDPAENVRTSFRVTVDKVDGTWKVAHFDRRDVPCDPG